jgi:UPF0755 protein
MRTGGEFAQLRPLLWLASLIVFGTALVVGGVYVPYRGFSNDVFLDFPKGTSTRQIAAQLARAGVIRYPWQFLVARAMEPRATLQAGEYRFDSPASVRQVYDRIARGDVFYYEITVPEGSNIFDIASIVDRSGIIPGGEFLRAAAGVKLIEDLDPGAATLEGYLFPSTYRITRRTNADHLARQMVDQFRKEWKTLSSGVTPAPGIHDTVTLASLVEKETAAPAERPSVASVYANRLRIGMKLDCDPTTIYAALLDSRYSGTIRRSDLASHNAYNTYQHAGLPPGPIANPGLASLKAALSPAQTDYLYFVAKPDGSGSHHFSSDFSSHEKAVQAYRRAQSKAAEAR